MRYYFDQSDQSDSVFLPQCSIFEDDESRFAYSQSHKIKVTIDWTILLAQNTISNGELSDPLCDSVNRFLGKDLSFFHHDSYLFILYIIIFKMNFP